MDESTEHGLLALCPRCRYSLRGLPVEHRCPECGLLVDRRWEVFGGRPVWGTSYRAMLIYPLVALGIGWLAGVILIVLQGRLFFGTVLPLVSITLAAFVIVMMSFGRPPGFVAVGPRGVAVYRGRGRLDRYPWSRIGQARLRSPRKTLDLVIDGRPVIIPGFFTFRGNVFEAERCVRFINTYHRDESP